MRSVPPAQCISGSLPTLFILLHLFSLDCFVYESFPLSVLALVDICPAFNTVSVLVFDIDSVPIFVSVITL